jgi:hypothetical protein
VEVALYLLVALDQQVLAVTVEQVQELQFQDLL